MDWAALAERHVDRVYRAARAEVGDDHAAWDCVQEAFATALLGGEPDHGDPVDWLCGVARNHARHWKRSETRWRRAMEGLAARRLRREPGPVDASALREALARLPLKLRDAVSLRYLAGMTAEDVARAQGISASAAKMRVHRGLARLRAQLGGAALVALLVGQAQAGASGVAAAVARHGHVGAGGLLTGFVMKKIALSGLALALLLAAGLLLYARRGSGGTADRFAWEPSTPVDEAEPRRDVEAELAAGPASSDSRTAYPAKRPVAPLRGVVADEQDKPVAGVTVTVRADFGGIVPDFSIADDRSITLTVRAADDGTFGAELPVGPYRLAARADDGRVASAQWAVTDPPEMEPMRLVLKAPKGPPFSVTVVDSAGQPVPGANVEVVAAVKGIGIMGEGGMPPLRGVTDADGRCGFEERPDAALAFATTEDGRLGWAMAPSLFAFTGAQPTRVQVDIAGALRGRLSGVRADRLQDAIVVAHALYSVDAVYYGTFGRSYEAVVRDGAYSFEHLAAGKYALTLRSPSGARLVLPRFRWGRDEVENSVATATAEVVAGNTAVRDLEVTVGGTLRGRVMADGKPVANALVTAALTPRNPNLEGLFQGVFTWDLRNRETFRPHPEARRQTCTGPDGGYELPGLQPGLHRIEVFAQGLSYDRRMDVDVEDGKTIELRHALEPSGVLQGVTTEFWLGVTPKGERPPRLVVSLDNGLFTLPGLPPGAYELLAYRDPTRPSVFAETEVRAGETTWLDLRNAGPMRLICQVIDDGRPVGDVRVRIWGHPWTRTGADGAVEARAVEPWTGAAVEVHHAELSWHYTVTAAQRDETTWTARIPLGAHRAEVHTLDVAGTPVEAEITLSGRGTEATTGASWQLNAQRRVPPTGELALEGLLEGEYQLTARFPDGTETRSSLAVPRTEPLVVAASRTGTVAITLADASGRPAAGVQAAIVIWRGEGPAPDDVEAFWNGVLDSKAGTTGSDGSVRLEGVPAGTALLGFYQPKGERQWPVRRGDGPFVRYLRVEIAPDNTLALELVTGDPVLRDR